MPGRFLLNCCNILILVLGFVVSSHTILAANSGLNDYSLNFSTWSQKDGLPDWRIFSFMQDQKGLIWLSTIRGLYTFDGYEFREAIPGSVLNGKDGFVQTILEGPDNKIWLFRRVGERMEIDIFDPEDEEITPLYMYYDLGRSERMIFPKGDYHNLSINNEIWMFSEGGMYHFGDSITQLKSVSFSKPLKLFPAAKGFWDVSTRTDLVILKDNQAELLDTFRLQDGLELQNLFGNKNLGLVLQVKTQENEHLYIELESKNGRITSTRFDKLPKQDWFNYTVYGIGSGKLLLHGIYTESDGKSVFLKDVNGDFSFNLSQDYPEFVNSFPFFIDKDGAIWTSNPEGLFRWEIYHSPYFTKYLDDDLLSYSTRGLVEKDGKLYVTSYSGARIVDIQTGKHQDFNIPDNRDGFCIESIGDDLYIGKSREDSILVKYTSKGISESYFYKPGFSEIYDILEVKGKLWLGTSAGLVGFDGTTKTFVPIAIPEIRVYHIYENRIGFWLLTNDGLFLVNEEGTVLHRFLSKSEDINYRKLTHVYEDRAGDFWISTTGGGLILFDVLNGQIKKVLDTKDGLVHNNIHAVYPDNHNNLWLSSDHGLMRLNMETFKITSYFEEDGISNNEFNFLSHYQDSNGKIFFGGVNGVTVFQPNDIPEEISENLPTIIVDARSFNIFENKYQYQIKHGNTKDLIILRPEDSFLELGLSAIEFANSKNIKFLWKINNLQTDWVIQNDPVIRLSKLDYGDHVLEFSAFRTGNKPGQNFQSVRIRVIKPYYLKFPFILFVAIAGGSMAYFISLWRTKYLERENLKLEKIVEARTFQIEQDKEIILEQAEGLRKMDRLKSRFFSNITHEFRTPLSLMLGPLDRLINGDIQKEKSKEYLMLIKRNATKLLYLIDELLDFTKIEEKNVGLTLENIEVYPFLRHKISIFNALAKLKNITLELNYKADTLLVIKSDLGKWRKIISNLLDNAIKYTPQKGKVAVSFEESGGTFLLKVTDTGPGISSTDLPFIFDRFYRSPDIENNVEGTGIGLSLCKEYCDLLGAKISANSIPGRGSEFQIAFSAESIVLDEKAPLPTNEEAPVQLANDTPKLNSEKVEVEKDVVLLVEDEPDMLSFLKDILQQDYCILAAGNGEEALHLLTNHKVDLIVSDLMMPGIDGLQLLSKVKVSYERIPFILLTARVASEDKIRALEIGVDDYLGKPFNSEELLVRIENLINRYKIRLSMRGAKPESEADTGSFAQQWTEQLEAVVKEHLSNPDFTVMMLAEKMNVSQRNLQYKTKSMIGLNPKQFILEIRLNEAIKLLENKAYPTVSEVGYAVGFKSAQYFSKVMKKRFGRSPSEYL